MPKPKRSWPHWLGTEAVLIYPSVTLANLGAIPGLVGRQDLLVVDEQAHNSMQEGAKIARANGVRVLSSATATPPTWTVCCVSAGPYRVAVVAIDGVYSMTGALPPLAELDAVCLRGTTPCSTWTTPTARACLASRDAARFSTPWAATTTRWWSARCPRPSPASAASSAARRSSSIC